MKSGVSRTTRARARGSASRWSTWFAVAMSMLLAAATTGCGGSGVSDAVSETPGNPDNPSQPDKVTNGALTVDEWAIVGAIDSTKLIATIPVQASSKTTKGALQVSLARVGGDVTTTVAVDYALDPDERASLLAELPLADGLDRQADFVAYNLLVRGADGLRVTRSLLYVVPPFDVRLEGPRSLLGGQTAFYRVRAEDPTTHLPLAGIAVDLVVREGDSIVEKYSAITAPTGDAAFEVNIAALGSYEIAAMGSSDGALAEVDDGVNVVDLERKVLLTTDKPLYQPGQTIHLRALALERPSLRPAEGEDVTFEVEDGKGNKIFKSTIATDSYGIAATTFAIGPIVNMGTFQIRAIVGEQTTQKSVEVSQYALPKFRVGMTVDKSWYAPGEELHGQLDAGYFFGKPVAGGSVKIEAYTIDIGETVFQEVLGTTDADGALSFSVTLPSSLVGLPLEQGKAVVGLRASVTDTAQQEVQKSKAVIVADAAIDIAIVPEAGSIVPGVDNRMLVFASDPLGAPLAAVNVTVATAGNDSVSLTTDAFGQAQFQLTLADATSTVTVSTTAKGASGPAVNDQFHFDAQAGANHVLVRTEQAVYGIGDTVHVDVLVSQPGETVYMDWLNNGQVVDMRTLTAEDGMASFMMDLDNSLMGSNRVEAYIVDSQGLIVRAGRTLFVRSESALTVQLTTDKPLYEPGEDATLTFSVTDEAGRPAAAALGVQIVDEAVFALIDAKPGLLRTYFELQDEFAEPRYEIHGPNASLTELFFEDTISDDPAEVDAAQAKAEGAIAALGGTSVTGIQAGSWPTALAEAKTLLAPAYAAQKLAVATAATGLVEEAKAKLAAQGCTPEAYYCNELQMYYSDAVAAEIAGQVQAIDFWGNAMVAQTPNYGEVARLTSSGPDEQAGTSDDHSLVLTLADVGIENSWCCDEWGGQADAGVGGEGGIPEAPNNDGEGGGGGKSSDDEGGPRVRQDFPETLYVNPALITDGSGMASVQIPMADSITEWRVSSLAHTKNGKLGGGQAGVTVFQDFFVDIDFPATLTRGDEVSFPVALYNYLDQPQSVKLSMQPGDWFTSLGDTETTIDLAPGQVVGVRFPVRVDTVGLHTLTVVGLGAEKSDAVARTVRVIPDGAPVSLAASGALESGTVEHEVTFPENAVPGSEQLYLNVFPAFLSQAVSGMDSILQVPAGCFEQTTSTTWPNVLVTDYMRETGQITPEIQLKAESLISAGYQRLLTFEHPGGGFSWFGTSDPEPFLSVTAFGLMEFVDMALVSEVDPVMIERTRQWILSVQEADGSWPGDVSEFFTFHTSNVRNTAFVLWSLATAGTQGSQMAQGVAYVKANLYNSEPDAYTLGLVANAMAIAAPGDPMLATILSDLDEMKQVEGDLVYWTSGGTQTPFYESGDSSTVSATAMVALAYMQAGGYKANVDGALAYLLSKKDALGNWQSTQATVWTLRALLRAAKSGSEGATGTFTVAVDGETVQALDLTADKWDVMTTVNLADFATTGVHTVNLSFAGEGKASYNLVSKHHVPWEQAPDTGTGVLSLSMSYDKTNLAVNDTAEVTLTVTNNTAATYNMVMVDVGIPPGFEVLSEDLQAYVDGGTSERGAEIAPTLSNYETTAKQLSLYITALPGSGSITYTYRVRATMPVKAEDGGAVAYLYYETGERATVGSSTLEATE